MAKRTAQYRRAVVAALLLALASSLVLPEIALAQGSNPLTGGSTTTTTTAKITDKAPCTTFAQLREKADDGKPGIITNVTEVIKNIVGATSKNLYEAFTKNQGYQNAVNAAMTLMVIFYAVAFLIGLVQPNFGQILIRLMKMGIIYAMISPSGWAFFSQYAVTFFNDGTDELIRGVLSIGTGHNFQPGESPFRQLDALGKWMISPDMIIAILGTTFSTGPYGLSVGLLMAFAFGGVIKLLIEGLKIYALSFILRALLFGVAPIFVIFLLFDKTRNLFMGWLNALINLSLQPILYFTFISFFIVMIIGASQDMLGANNLDKDGKPKPIEFCWSELEQGSGQQNKVAFWRIKLPGESQPDLSKYDWRGSISCLISTDKDKKCDAFPINIIDLLSFLILIFIAMKFADTIERLSSEISSAFVNLDTQSKFDLGQKKSGEDGGSLLKNEGVPGAKATSTSRTDAVPGRPRAGS